MVRVSFDLDGVLVDYLAAAIEQARELFPGRVPEMYSSETCAYSMQDVLSFNEWRDALDKLYKKENFWETLAPLQPNLNDFKVYAKSGKDEIYVITARPNSPDKSVVGQIMTWFTKQGVPIARERVYVTKHSSDKAALIKQLGIKFSVDDLYTTVDQCNKIPGHKAFLFNQSWNMQVPDMPRVESIAQFIGTVRILG